VEGSDIDGDEDGGPGGSSWVMAEDLDGPGAEERAAALARFDAMLQDPRPDGPAWGGAAQGRYGPAAAPRPPRGAGTRAVRKIFLSQFCY